MTSRKSIQPVITMSLESKLDQLKKKYTSQKEGQEPEAPQPQVSQGAQTPIRKSILMSQNSMQQLKDLANVVEESKLTLQKATHVN